MPYHHNLKDEYLRTCVSGMMKYICLNRRKGEKLWQNSLYQRKIKKKPMWQHNNRNQKGTLGSIMSMQIHSNCNKVLHMERSYMHVLRKITTETPQPFHYAISQCQGACGQSDKIIQNKIGESLIGREVTVTGRVSCRKLNCFLLVYEFHRKWVVLFPGKLHLLGQLIN